MTGEETHEAGRIGAQRAKRYLDATTRAEARWLNPSGARKLSFKWADREEFSFDLGGNFLGDDLDGLEFLAESKYYKTSQDLGTHYRKYLAGCYRAYSLLPARCDVFMWISWSPFLVTIWDQLTTPEYVERCVQEHQSRAVEVLPDGTLPPPDPQLCKAVAERLWLLILSPQHERLVPTVRARKAVKALLVGDHDGNF